MFTFDGGVKILDFGIALMRDREAPVTVYGTIKGKPDNPDQGNPALFDRIPQAALRRTDASQMVAQRTVGSNGP